MKDDLGLNTKKAMQELLLALEHEHPEVLKGGWRSVERKLTLSNVFFLRCLF